MAGSLNAGRTNALFFGSKGRKVKMAVKVLIKRYFKEESTADARGLINEFRKNAMNQAGYISGETWVNHYDPRSMTVLSTWQTVEDWIRWQESDERDANEARLRSLQAAPATFEIYDLATTAKG